MDINSPLGERYVTLPSESVQHQRWLAYVILDIGLLAIYVITGVMNRVARFKCTNVPTRRCGQAPVVR